VVASQTSYCGFAALRAERLRLSEAYYSALFAEAKPRRRKPRAGGQVRHSLTARIAAEPQNPYSEIIGAYLLDDSPNQVIFLSVGDQDFARD